jgi:hypothetical protein
MPIPTPEIRGNNICKYVGAFSSIKVSKPKKSHHQIYNSSRQKVAFYQSLKLR